jgi:hypothetical protein
MATTLIACPVPGGSFLKGEHMPKAAKKQSQPVTSETEAIQPSQALAASPPTDEEIAVRAYHIYLERSGGEGNPDDDWIQAKRELTEGSQS